jgi:hypothetical protein
MRGRIDSALPEDISYEILSCFSYDDDADTLLICALVSRSWACISRSRWTLKVTSNNFWDLQRLLDSPMTSFAWVRNLVVLTRPGIYWFRETVPYLAALKRVNSLSLIRPPPFSNFDELLNLLCLFPSLQSVLLSGVYISDWTWSPSRPRGCPSLSSISLETENSGIFQWLQSQKGIHKIVSFRTTIRNAHDFGLMDSFLQPSAGLLRHLHITFARLYSDQGENYLLSSRYQIINSCEQNSALTATFGISNYQNLQSLKLENIRDVELVPRVLKQITSTELKHLVLDWDLIIGRRFPCDWSELGEILAKDQFSNLLTIEMHLDVDIFNSPQIVREAEAEAQRCMPKRDGQGFHKLSFKTRRVFSPYRCPSW